MRALKWLFIVIVVLIVGAVAAGFVLPDRAHVERSVTTRATPGTVYAVLNGFRQFNKWSPWANLDPSASYTLEGPVAGVGARSSWSSANPSVGSGSQEIVEARANEYLCVRLVFSGFDSENYSTYTLQPEGEGTRITWGYDSIFHSNLMGRYFGLLLDRMIGADLDEGLVRLKALVETLPAVSGAVPLEVVAVEARPMLYVSGETTVEHVAAALAADYRKIEAFMAANGLKAAEPPMAITREFDEETKFWRYDAAIVPDRADVAPPADGAIRAGMRPAGLAIRAEHLGPHDTMDASYEQIIAYKTAAGLEDGGPSWEQYLTDPATTPAAELKSHIYWAVK